MVKLRENRLWATLNIPITQRFPANGKHYKSRVRDIPGFQTTILRMEPEWSLTLRRVSEFREGEGNPMYFGGANDSYPDGVQANTVREWTLSQCENNKRLKTARTNFQKVLAKKRVNKLSKEERTRASCLNGTSQGKPVLQLTRLDNVPIAGYYSQWEAEDYTGVSKNSISQVCMGQGKSTGGFAWRFASKEFIESEEWARLVEVGRQRSELTKNKYVKPCNRKVVPPPE